jgi:hypothetical protein
MSALKARILDTSKTIAIQVPLIKDFYAKMINNIMFECSQINGAYLIQHDEYTTNLVIIPAGNGLNKKRRSKLLRHREIYLNIFYFVSNQHPYCLDE